MAKRREKSNSFSNVLCELFDIGKQIYQQIDNPNTGDIGAFVGHFIWICNYIEKHPSAKISKMGEIERETRLYLDNKWDNREWKRYLLHTAFRFKDGNSKPSQEIVNRFLMLIEYVKSLRIKLKDIKNYFKAKEEYTKEENLLGWIQYMCFQFPRKYTNREKGRETSYPLQQGKNYRKVMQLLGSITFNKIAFGIGRQEKQLIHSINIVIQGGVNAGQEFIRKNSLKAILMTK